MVPARIRIDLPALLGRIPLIGPMLAGRDARLALSAISVFAIRIAGAALAYILAILMVHLLGVRQFGIYAHLYAATGLLALVLPLGFNSAVLRFIPDYLRRGRHARLAGLIGASRAIVVLTSVAVALVLAALTVAFRDALPGDYFLPLLVAIACLPLLACLDLYESFARGFGWTVLAYVPPYVIQPLALLVFLVGAVAAGATANAAVALVGLAIATVVALAVLAILFQKRARGEIDAVPARFHARAWTAAALPLVVVEASRAFLEQTDILLLAMISGPEEVAAYFAAMRTAGLLGFIFFAAAALAVPQYSELYGSRRMRALRRVIRTTLHLTFWPTLAGVAFLALLGPFILGLFDPAFVGAFPAMMVLSLGFLVRAAAGPVEFLLAAAGDQAAAARIYMLGALANIALNLLLIPYFGLLGAAAATTVSVILVTALLVIRAWRRVGVLSLLHPRLAVPEWLRRRRESVTP